MPPRRSRDVLLVLCKRTVPSRDPAGEATRALISIMESVRSRELHVFHVRDHGTSGFEWPCLLEFRVPREESEAARHRRAQWLRAEVTARCTWLQHDEPRVLSLSQTGFGEERDGADFIVSLYSWTPAVERSDRERSMWAHFEMEREEPNYTAVHFNVSNIPENDFDFVFQSYVDDADGLSRIYSSSRLEMMREHSRSFLDTETRRLAFGDVQILTLPEAVDLGVPARSDRHTASPSTPPADEQLIG